MSLYIHGTKKGINERIAAGEKVTGIDYSPRSSKMMDLKSVPNGTGIKFWLKKDFSGTPIAKSYGCVKGGKII